MVIVMGQLDHSSFPKALISSAPCRTNQLLKSETLMLYCLPVYSFIYLFSLDPPMHRSFAWCSEQGVP